MSLYVCIPCGLNWKPNSGGTCYVCGQKMEMAFTAREVKTIVNTPTQNDVDDMFRIHLENHKDTKL